MWVSGPVRPGDLHDAGELLHRSVDATFVRQPVRADLGPDGKSG